MFGFFAHTAPRSCVNIVVDIYIARLVGRLSVIEGAFVIYKHYI